MRARSHDGMVLALSRPVDAAAAPVGCIWMVSFLVRTTGSSPGAWAQAAIGRCVPQWRRSQWGQPTVLVGWQVKQALFEAMFCTALLLLPLDRLLTDELIMAVNWLELPPMVTSPTLEERFWLA